MHTLTYIPYTLIVTPYLPPRFSAPKRIVALVQGLRKVFDIYLDHKITAADTHIPHPTAVTGVLDLVVELLTTDGSNET